MAKERILIIGGGFGGVKTALELAEDDRFHVTLVSDRSDLRYYPTLYHVATGGKSRNATIPLKELFKGKSIKFIQNTAATIDRKAKFVTMADGTAVSYDTVILALGVVTNYFGIPGLAEYSYSIKSIEEINRFKDHIHQQLTEDKAPDLNYIIVGGGPTGIELAGSLPAYLREVMKNHGIKARRVNVRLIEAAPRLLPRLPKDTSRLVSRRLKRLGVKVMTGQIVQGATATELTVSGTPIQSETIVWTAGVTNHPFFAQNNFVMLGRGKVATDIYLQTEDNVFVLGDNANTPYSGLALTAVLDGKFVADNLKRRKDGKDFKPYKPFKAISVIPVGERWAVLIWGKLRVYGWLGWIFREAADLVGFHDYQSAPKAAEQWLTTFGKQETCPVCLKAMTAKK